MTASTEAAAISDGPLPKHLQLTTLLTALATHELSPGEAIPSERELMTRYALSRATVRRSIESLISDGLLERVHGKGTFVARPRLESRLHLASFSQDMRRRGLTPSTRLLELAAHRPPPEVATTLGLRRTGWPGGCRGCGSPTAGRSRSRTAGTRGPRSRTSTATTSAARSTRCSRRPTGW